MIPPAILGVAGDASAFDRTATKVKVILTDLAKGVTVPIRGDVKGLIPDAILSSIGSEYGGKIATSVLSGIENGLNARAGGAISQAVLAGMNSGGGGLIPESVLRSIGSDMGGKIDDGILAGIEAGLNSRAGGVISDSLLASLNKGGGGLIPASVLAALEGGGGKGGGGLGSLLAGFFSGKGGRFSTAGLLGVSGAAAAGFDLAGLSVGHMAVAGLDLAGSAVSALGGGLLKAFAGGATMAVGVGTNMAGIGQAANDAKMMFSDVNNVGKAAAEYGKNSYQYQAAVAQMKYDLNSFAAVARGPVMNLVKAVGNLRSQFDKATGPAEAKGANILTSVVKSLGPFVTIIGKFASINMTTINKGLQPLLKFLDSPSKNGGLGIFTELEKIFSSHLPTGMKAFTNGIEALIKVAGQVAPTTGGFLTSLAKGLAKLNNELNSKNSKASQGIQSLLKTWDAWYAFFKQLFTDAYRLFSNGKDQHTGLAIIKQLTGYLQEFGKWESSVSGSKSITRMFSASKGELTTMVSLLPPLAKSIGGFIGALAPAMHGGMTVGLKGLVKVLDGLSVALKSVSKLPGMTGLINFMGSVGGFALGVGLLASKMKLLKGPVDSLVGLLTKIPGISKVPIMGSLLSKAAGNNPNSIFSSAVTEFSAAVNRFVGGSAAGEGGLAATAGKVAGKGGALALGGSAAAMLATAAALGLTTKGVFSAGQTNTPLEAALLAYSKSKGQPIAQQTSAGRGGAVSPLHMFGANQQSVMKYLTSSTLMGGMGLDTKQAKQALAQINKMAQQLGAQASKDFKTAGTNAAKGYASGIHGGAPTVNKATLALGSSSLGSLRKAIRSASPSKATELIGTEFVQGYAKGIGSDTKMLTNAVAGLGRTTLNRLHADLPQYHTAGQNISKAIASGITSGQGVIAVAIHNVIQQTVNGMLRQMVGGHVNMLATSLGAGAGMGY